MAAAGTGVARNRRRHAAPGRLLSIESFVGGRGGSGINEPSTPGGGRGARTTRQRPPDEALHEAQTQGWAAQGGCTRRVQRRHCLPHRRGSTIAIAEPRPCQNTKLRRFSVTFPSRDAAKRHATRTGPQLASVRLALLMSLAATRGVYVQFQAAAISGLPLMGLYFSGVNTTEKVTGAELASTFRFITVRSASTPSCSP